MSVNVQKINGKFFVNAKPDNASKDSLGSAGLHVECRSEEEAKTLAAKMKEVETRVKNEMAEAGPVKLDESSKTQGVGDKLDLKAA